MNKETWPIPGFDPQRIKEADCELVETFAQSLPDHGARKRLYGRVIAEIRIAYKVREGGYSDFWGTGPKLAYDIFVNTQKRYEALAAEEANEPDPGTWDNLTAAVALHALLRAAQMPPGISERAVGRFAKMLTGQRSAGTMATAYGNAKGRSFPDVHAQIVADALIDLGLTRAAADVRAKFQD